MPKPLWRVSTSSFQPASAEPGRRSRESPSRSARPRGSDAEWEVGSSGRWRSNSPRSALGSGGAEGQTGRALHAGSLVASPEIRRSGLLYPAEELLGVPPPPRALWLPGSLRAPILNALAGCPPNFLGS